MITLQHVFDGGEPAELRLWVARAAFAGQLSFIQAGVDRHAVA